MFRQTCFSGAGDIRHHFDVMTRRGFIYAAFSGFTPGCAQQQPKLLSSVKEMEQRDQLALIDGDAMSTLDRTWSARLKHPDGSWYPPAIAPDGRFVAWSPFVVSAPPPRLGQRVLLSDGLGEPRSIQVNGLPGLVAVDSGGSTIATVLNKGANRELAVIDTANGNEEDLSHLVPGLDLRNLRRLRLSGSGDRLLVGDDTSFCLIDMSSGKVLIKKDVRYASISPDGTTIAFAEGHQINLQSLTRDPSARIVIDQPIDFLGGWSPDGRFLLAGASKAGSWSFSLIVVDVKAQTFAEALKQPGEMSSEIYWIHKRFGVPTIRYH